MLVYIVRRLMWTPVVLFVVSFSTFALGFYGPGDPVQVRMGQRSDPEVAARLRHEMGLDRPFAEQYVTYVWKALHGDFGESYRYPGTQIGDVLGRKVWVSFQLALISLLIGVFIGMALGMLAALYQGRSIDTAIVITALFLSSLPVLIVQPVLVLIISRWMNLVPSSGWDGLLSLRIIMPVIVMSLGGIGGMTRLMRASTLEVIGQDYVRTAHAKGLTQSDVLWGHVAQNAVLPVFTVVGLSLAGLVEGAFIVETLFGIPGIGAFMVDAVFQRDYPAIQAMGLLVATMYVLANLFVDIGYSFLDPRIRAR